MKLLFITRKFPPAIGGMEMFAKDLSDELAQKVDLKLIKWSGYGQLKAVVLGIPQLTVKAFAALLTNKVDIIHAQDGVLAPVGWLLSRLFRKPFTVIIHGLDITFTNPLFRVAVPWAVKKADLIFCISQSAADEVAKIGADSDKVVVIPIAVKDVLYDKSNTKSALTERLALDPEAPLLVTVGRLVKRKGVAWFIEVVLPDLTKQFPKLIYLVVGDGNNRPEVEAAIERSGMTSHVRLLGRIEDDLYKLVYNNADVFVMPNINVPGDMEGFGLVNLEASLCELPVVAADTEGIKDAIKDGQNGFLVPVQNKDAFIQQISNLLKDPESAKKAGQKARTYSLEHYSWPVIADQYVEQYQKIVNSRLAKRP